MEKPKKSSCGCFPIICKKSKQQSPSVEFHQRLRSTILSSTLSPNMADEVQISRSLASPPSFPSMALSSPSHISPSFKSIQSTAVTEETPKNFLTTLRNRFFLKQQENNTISKARFLFGDKETSEKIKEDLKSNEEKVEFVEESKKNDKTVKTKANLKQDLIKVSIKRLKTNYEKVDLKDKQDNDFEYFDEDVLLRVEKFRKTGQNSGKICTSDKESFKNDLQVECKDQVFETEPDEKVHHKEFIVKKRLELKKSFKGSIKITNISNDIALPGNFKLAKTKSPTSILSEKTPVKIPLSKTTSKTLKSKESPYKIKKPGKANPVKSKKKLFLVKNPEIHEKISIDNENKHNSIVIHSKNSSLADTVIINSVDTSMISNLFCKDHEVNESCLANDEKPFDELFCGDEVKNDLKVKSIPFSVCLAKNFNESDKKQKGILLEKKKFKGKNVKKVGKVNTKSLPCLIATSPKVLGSKAMFKFK